MLNSNDDFLDLDAANLGEDVAETLEELSLENEAMKVLTALAEENGLQDDVDLIRFIYQEAVKAHENEQGLSDSTTLGRKIYEKVVMNRQQQAGDQ